MWKKKKKKSKTEKEKGKKRMENEFVLHELTKAVLNAAFYKIACQVLGCSNPVSLFIFWLPLVDFKRLSPLPFPPSLCDDEYVGETLRALQVRAKEHRDAIRLGNTEKSAVAQHHHQQEEPHEIDWSTMSVIDRVQAWRERKL